MCDMVYVIHIEMIETRATAERIGLIVCQSMSDKKIDLPDPDEARARFDELLNEEPKQVLDPRMWNIRKALGV